MFQRRVKFSFWRRVRTSIWPGMGWPRTVIYYKHRLMRGHQSTHRLVGGLAIGASVSFSPLLGTHFAESVFLAWIFRFSKLAAFVGTGIGNPLTFPLMFWADYKLGEFLFALFGYGSVVALPGEVTWHYFIENPLKLFLPMLVGGTLIGVIVWPMAYALFYYPVKLLRRPYDRRYRQRSDRHPAH